MRLLVACPECRRQYQARRDKVGTRFRCRCGQTLSVALPRGHDSRIVRCSSCGAARTGASRDCEHCGSDFTLHERDLLTVCPACLTFVSDRARYCHSCGGLIAPEENIGPTSDLCCPACLDESLLHSRRLGAGDHAVLECDACAGLWIGAEVFEHLARKAQEATLPPLPGGRSDRELLQPDLPPQRSGYCPCPACGKLMHRRNYGYRLGQGGSGIIVEYCKDDGIWFNAGELAGVLNWLRCGRPAEQALVDRADDAPQPSPSRPPDAVWRSLSGDSRETDMAGIFDIVFAERHASSVIAGGLVGLMFDIT